MNTNLGGSLLQNAACVFSCEELLNQHAANMGCTSGNKFMKLPVDHPRKEPS